MENPDIISEKRQYNIIKMSDNLRKKAFFSMIYLTGARPSELCNSYKRKVIRDANKNPIKTLYVGKRNGILTEDIKIEGDDVSITLPIRKKRVKVRAEHTLVFDINTPYMPIILEYHKTKTNPKEPLFNFTTRTAQRYIADIRKLLNIHGLNCKLYRHTRLTKISKIAQTEEEIRQWAGHSDTRSLGIYIAMRPITTFKKRIR